VDRQQHIAAKAEVSPDSGVGHSGPRADAPRTFSGGRDLTTLVEQLRNDRFADQDLNDERIHGYRAGWNAGIAHAAKLIDRSIHESRINRGLAELRAFDIDQVDENGAGDA
jgi:hypothetical protein